MFQEHMLVTPHPSRSVLVQVIKLLEVFVAKYTRIKLNQFLTLELYLSGVISDICFSLTVVKHPVYKTIQRTRIRLPLFLGVSEFLICLKLIQVQKWQRLYDQYDLQYGFCPINNPGRLYVPEDMLRCPLRLQLVIRCALPQYYS